MDINKIKLLAAQEVMARNLESSYFSVCAVTKGLKLAGIACQCRDSMLILDSLHCVDYVDMNPELRDMIPELLDRVINGNNKKSEGYTIRFKGTKLLGE